MVTRLIILSLLCASPAWAVSLKDLVARISAESIPAASVIGGAVDLDGSTEYFTDPSASLFDVPDLTYLCWFNPRTHVNYAGLIANYSGNYSIALQLYNSYGGVYVANYQTAGSGSNGTIGITGCYTSNAWNMACVTFTKNGNAVLYVNTTNKTLAGMTINCRVNDNVRLGYEDYNAARKFNGLLDECSIWTRALSSNEVMELYNGGLGKPATSLSTGTNGLLRYWKLDDGLSNSSATNAYDSASGTYATGTAIGSGDWTNGIVPQ